MIGPMGTLTTKAPPGTLVVGDLSAGGVMLQAHGLVAHVHLAGEFDLPNVEDAIDDFLATKMHQDTIDRSSIRQELLDDGYVFTAESDGLAGRNFWVKCLRNVGGRGIVCETTAASAAQQANVVTVA